MRRSRLNVVFSLALASVAYIGVALFSPFVLADEPPQKKPSSPPAGAPAHPGVASAHPGAAPGHPPAGHGPDPRDHLARDHRAFAHRDFAHFDGRERRLWLAGRWNQTCFDGHCGWWWNANGIWHFYDQPIYPHPLFVSEVVFVEPVAVIPVAPVVVAPVAPPMAVQPSAAAQTRYYCDNPAGYFPAVQNCNGDFRPVAP